LTKTEEKLEGTERQFLDGTRRILGKAGTMMPWPLHSSRLVSSNSEGWVRGGRGSLTSGASDLFAICFFASLNSIAYAALRLFDAAGNLRADVVYRVANGVYGVADAVGRITHKITRTARFLRDHIAGLLTRMWREKQA
jgi:hypothetical protein